MQEVGSYEAKTHLSSLLERVANGERFAITRHGVPIALLSPFPELARPDTLATIEELLAFRSSHSLKGLSVKEMIQEGRRH